MRPIHKYLLAAALPLVTSDALTCVLFGQLRGPVAPTEVASNAPADAANFTLQASQEKIVHVVVGHSLFIGTTLKLSRIYITNPTTLSAYAASPNQVLVTAKSAGLSSVVVWDQSGSSQQYLVSSDLDLDQLRDSIKKSIPNEEIHADSDGERIVLSGVVGTPAESQAAATLAGLYTKDVFDGLVVNSSRVRQVKLKVRILEVDRSKVNQFGINIFNGAGNTLAQTSTLQFPSQLSTGSSTGSGSAIETTVGSKILSITNPLNFILYNSSIDVGAILQDLENKQILQILAEPTISTLSGQKGSFLSGGEFPFPVVQGISGGTTSISVQFRPYGVKLDFTPQVNIDGTIELDVAPEVSALDYTNAVSIDGYEIPALSTRRADTKVVLKDGQSFAISGLLDRRTTDQLSRTPGIASIPILGELFKSKSIDHSRTDLIVVVTPEIVDPVSKPDTVTQLKFPVNPLDPDAFDKTLPQSKNAK